MSQLPNYVITDRKGTKTVSTGSAWEPKMGYSRAVRKGNMIFVTGTVGINADKTYTPDVGAQARRSLAIVQGAIESLGGKISDVVRFYLFVRIWFKKFLSWKKVKSITNTRKKLAMLLPLKFTRFGKKKSC